MVNDSDQQELRLLRSGDAEAFERFVKRWDTEVLNLAYRLTGSREDAKDIRQNAFIRAYRGLISFRGQACLSTWLFRVVINLCRDHIRNQQQGLRLRQSHAQATANSWTGACDPSQTADQQELQVQVAQAVACLPVPEREVLVLRHYHRLNFRQISELLGIPITTAKSRVVSALRKMRDRLSKSCHLPTSIAQEGVS